METNWKCANILGDSHSASLDGFMECVMMKNPLKSRQPIGNKKAAWPIAQ
jgi:hypothetical protein